MLQVTLLLLVALFFLFNDASKLWVRENIGEVTDWYFNKKSTAAHVSTKQNVIASLDLNNNGSIIWRQIFAQNDHINELKPTLDGKSLITLSNANVLRKWKASNGALLWETRQYTNAETLSPHTNADMMILENHKIILIDNMNLLSVYDSDEGSLIWKKSIHANDKHNNTPSYHHKLYVDEISKTVYIITFYPLYAIIESYALNTGEPIQIGNEYRHECAGSIPTSFQVLSSLDSDPSLIVFYECNPLSVTPLYAFVFSIASQSDLQITPLSVSLDNANPSLTNWKLIKDAASLTLSAEYCQIYDVNIKKSVSSVSLIKSTQECERTTRNIWRDRHTDAKGVLKADGSLCFVKDSSMEWCREEALSQPLYVYLFDETEDESSLCSEEMNEEECEASYNAPFSSFPVRLMNDIQSIVTLSGFSGFGFLNTFFPITSAWLDTTFEKTMTILTRSGKLFGLSSSTGDILWSINLLDLCGNNCEIVNMLSIRHHPPHLLAILSDNTSQSSTLISISSPFHIIGQKPHIHVDRVDYVIDSAFLTPWLTAEHSDKITLLISNENDISIYPSGANEKKVIASVINKIFYHTVSLVESSLSGYHLRDDKSFKIWSKSFKNSEEEIVDVVFSSHNQFIVNAVYRTGERGSIYKYLNPHLIGVATRENAHDLLHIYLMDGVTGRVYLHQYHSNVQGTHGSISMLLYENKFVYSFYNTQSMLTEIVSIDLWLSDPANVPTKARTPSEGYIVDENPLLDNVFSSFDAPLPYITSQVYNFRFTIDKLLAVSSTRYSVSNKWILALLSSGSVIQMDCKWLNTRRPIQFDATQANKEEMLIPYKSNIPFSNLWTVSHDATLNRITHAISVGSPIESTSSVFAYGDLDLFYTLITPARNFDTIPPDFDYPMLALILSGVAVAIVVARYMVQSKKIKKEWK